MPLLVYSEEEEGPKGSLLPKFHPNSLQAKALKDPELAEKLRRGRQEADEEAQVWEHWARSGCTAVPG